MKHEAHTVIQYEVRHVYNRIRIGHASTTTAGKGICMLTVRLCIDSTQLTVTHAEPVERLQFYPIKSSGSSSFIRSL